MKKPTKDQAALILLGMCIPTISGMIIALFSSDWVIFVLFIELLLSIWLMYKWKVLFWKPKEEVKK